jgi:sugar (pentulose or hexulose) kinase
MEAFILSLLNWIRRATLGPICQRRNSGYYRGTTNAHIARATLEGIAYQVYDLAKSMEADFEKRKELKSMAEQLNN